MREPGERREFRFSNAHAIAALAALYSPWPVLLLGMAFWSALFPDPARPSQAHERALLSLVVVGLLFLLAAAAYMSGQLGTGTVDAEGVSYKPWLRRVRRLRWHEVECVQWFRGHAWLQGGGTSISIPWSLFGKRETCREAKEWVRTALFPAFRLVDPPVQRPPSPAEARRSLLQSGTLLALTLGLCLFSFFKLKQNYEQNEAWMWGVWASMFGPFLLAPFLLARERHRWSIFHRRAPDHGVDSTPDCDDDAPSD